jgi:hypothetical protein
MSATAASKPFDLPSNQGMVVCLSGRPADARHARYGPPLTGYTGPVRDQATRRTPMANVRQPVTDDSIKVRQLTHYQFSWVAGDPGKPGTYTLQLVLDEGAWEEVLTLDPDDADNLQDLLEDTDTVHYDVERRVLMFGVAKVGD